MIAVFQRTENGRPIAVNSDYVVRAYQERDTDTTWLEVVYWNSPPYKVAVAGDIEEVVAKLNGAW